MSIEEITLALQLNNLRNRKWYVARSSFAYDAYGIEHGMNALGNLIGYKNIMSPENNVLSRKIQGFKDAISSVMVNKAEAEPTVTSNTNCEIYLRFFLCEVLRLLPSDANGWISSSIRFHDFQSEVDASGWVESVLKHSVGRTVIKSASSFSNVEVLFKWQRTEPDDFLQNLAAKSILDGDILFHHDRLYSAWIILQKHKHRRDALREIFHILRQVCGEEFNMTVTYFWAHIIDYALKSQVLSHGGFGRFLLMNPHLANENLILDYYTQEQLCSEPAKTMMLIPKTLALPSIIDRRSCDPNAKLIPTQTKLSDQEFLQAFEERKLKSWSHENMIRVIFCYCCNYGSYKGFAEARAALRHYQGDGFHGTLTRFWGLMVSIQMKDGEREFETFWQRTKSEIGNQLLWREYYSDHLIESKESITGLVVPDIKQLPQFRSS